MLTCNIVLDKIEKRNESLEEVGGSHISKNCPNPKLEHFDLKFSSCLSSRSTRFIPKSKHGANRNVEESIADFVGIKFQEAEKSV